MNTCAYDLLLSVRNLIEGTPVSVVAATRHSRPALTPPRVRPARLLRNVFDVAEARWALGSVVLFGLGGAAHLSDLPTWTFWVLYLVCYAVGGWEPAWAGIQALREKTLDVDLLMIVAAVAAAAIGQVFDGALLIIIFSSSGALEAIATRRTEESVRALLTLAPAQATRVQPNGTGSEELVDAEELAVGDHILIRPGERIGADGTVVAGESDVEQATITGEPLPLAKSDGDDVFAGTLNGTGVLTVRVDKPAAETVVARIVAMVAEASETKANTQLFIEKVEQRYSALMVLATLLLLIVPLGFGAEFEPTLLRAMTFMIVASPCAVVLATMPPLLAAMANAGRHGVLVKSAVALEKLSQVNQVAFDKTGTLTLGTPRVTDVQAFGIGTDDLLALAASAELSSEHPVGRAVVVAAVEAGLPLHNARGFAATPGRGVVAVVGEHRVEVGSPNLLTDDEPVAREVVTKFESEGRTAVVVLVGGESAGVIALADEVREAAIPVVAQLRSLTGNTPILLTGDNQAAATALAISLGIEDVRSRLLPEHKAAAIAELQAAGQSVAIVGDGINDAPAMATAHVGIAMGRTGSDLALETSDAVLVRDDLTLLPTAISVARRAERIVKANLVFAGAVITVLVIWDLAGTLPLPLGVAGHEGSTIVVALNGMRLLRERAWKV
jgi:heavy metal translocating P-type ATPase